MQEDKKHISFTADEIRKYHEGKLTPAEMHAMEKASLEDPFLADAMEGYEMKEVDIPADIDELKSRLGRRVQEKEDSKVIPMAATPFKWWRVAAMIVAIAGAGLIAYNLGFNNDRKELARNEQRTAEKPAPVENTHDSSVREEGASQPADISAGSNEVAVSKKNETVEEAKPAPNMEKVAAMPAHPPVAASRVAEQTKNDTLSLQQDRLTSLVEKETIAKKEDAFMQQQANSTTYTYSRMRSETKDTGLRAPRNATAFAAPANGASDFPKAKKQSLIASTNIFRGKVTDEQNNPLPFANITNSQDNVGTYADAQGNFVLTSPDSVMNVQVKSLGFENSTIQLKNALAFNRVTLKDDNSLAAIVLSNKTVNTRQRQNNMVLEEPEPADGWMKYDAYLANNLNLPDDYKGAQKQAGEVELSFEVNQLGEPVNIKVEKSLCEVCDKEAIRLLKEGPKWKRKAKKGRRTTITIPF